VLREHTSVTRVEHALIAGQHPAGPQAASQPAGSTDWPAEGSRDRPPPVDLELLTDQILTRLDNRRTAHRERLGRVF
jgi:hypothetical protein